MAVAITRRRALGVIGAATLAATVSVALIVLPGDDQAEGPPDVRIGEHTCDQCGMVISDARFAAGWRAASTTQKRFDDIGCMVARFRAESTDDMQTWVHDYETQAWVRTTAATFVVSADIHSPMGYGVAAFDTAEEATAYVTGHKGETLGWHALVETLMKRANDG